MTRFPRTLPLVPRSPRPVLAALLVVMLSAAMNRADAASLKVPADFATIQAAIDASAVGDVIVVSAGTYMENLTITGRSDLTIRAKSGDKVFVDGGGGAGDLLAISGSEQVLIRKLRFQNSSDDGISIAFSQSITIDRCRVKAVGGDGISLGFNLPVVVKGCTILDVGDDGIETVSAGVVIQDCRISNPGDDGIVVHGDTSTIEGNTIESPAGIGISLGADDIQAFQCLVVDNEITSPGQDGIALEDDARACFILDNKIAGVASADGIDVNTGSNDHVIVGNTCREAGSVGIELDGTGVIVEGNTVKKCGVGVALEPNADDSLVIENLIKKSTTVGVLVNGTTNQFVRNTAKGSGTFDLDDNTGAGSNGYVDNSFGTIDAP